MVKGGQPSFINSPVGSEPSCAHCPPQQRWITSSHQVCALAGAAQSCFLTAALLSGLCSSNARRALSTRHASSRIHGGVLPPANPTTRPAAWRKELLYLGGETACSRQQNEGLMEEGGLLPGAGHLCKFIPCPQAAKRKTSALEQSGAVQQWVRGWRDRQSWAAPNRGGSCCYPATSAQQQHHNSSV